jgi:hypothetical protein
VGSVVEVGARPKAAMFFRGWWWWLWWHLRRRNHDGQRIGDVLAWCGLVLA